MVAQTTIPFSDYLALPEDDPWTYEMIRGELYMSPQARFIHQRVQARLVRLLDEYVERQDLGSIVEPTNLYLDEVNYVQPDISYFTKAQSEALIDEVAVRFGAAVGRGAAAIGYRREGSRHQTALVYRSRGAGVLAGRYLLLRGRGNPSADWHRSAVRSGALRRAGRFSIAVGALSGSARAIV